MNEYTCPINPVHDDPIMKATDKDSPHRGEIVCGVCDHHIKWASQKDIVIFNTEQTVTYNETEAANALLCPLMSGMVSSQLKAWLERLACIQERCGWYDRDGNQCGIQTIFQSLRIIDFHTL